MNTTESKNQSNNPQETPKNREETKRQTWQRPRLQQLDLNLETAAGPAGLGDGMLGRS